MRYIIGLLLTYSALAQVPHSKIEEFSGVYQNHQGNASARNFEFDTVKFSPYSNFELYKQANTFFLQTPDQEIELSMLPDTINQLENLNIQDLNINSSNQELKASLLNLAGSTVDKNLHIKNLNLNCTNLDKDFILGTLELCFNKKTYLTIPKIVMDNEEIKNIKVDLLNNILKFEAKVFGLKSKGNGTAQYDSINNEVIIRIDKVKAGFFNVTKQVFDKLKENESKDFIVQRPYIRLLLN